VFVLFVSPYLSGMLLATFPSIVTVLPALFEPCLKKPMPHYGTLSHNSRVSFCFPSSFLTLQKKYFNVL
jgi:hypothetical protein